MSIEFIGLATTQESSEVIAPTGPTVQRDFLRRIALAHEASGFDRVLIGHGSSYPDGLVVAGDILATTDRLGVLLAQRPGFTAPTIAAREYATLDALHPGRLAVHIISGGSDEDQARDGDWQDKPARYRRSDEFMQVVRHEWTSETPFDFEGEFYRVKGGYSSVRPPEGRIPLYFGGLSAEAIDVGGQRADKYMFFGEPLAGIRENIARTQAAAASCGRTLSYSVSTRPIVADTETAAWERAREILQITQERAPVRRFHPEGSKRLLKFADEGEVHDTCLWTATAKATGGAGNSTSLVGTYEQVADALLAYVGLGVSTLLIRGFTPLQDAIEYGTLISLVRERAEAAAVARIAG